MYTGISGTIWVKLISLISIIGSEVTYCQFLTLMTIFHCIYSRDIIGAWLVCSSHPMVWWKVAVVLTVSNPLLLIRVLIQFWFTFFVSGPFTQILEVLRSFLKGTLHWPLITCDCKRIIKWCSFVVLKKICETVLSLEKVFFCLWAALTCKCKIIIFYSTWHWFLNINTGILWVSFFMQWSSHCLDWLLRCHIHSYFAQYAIMFLSSPPVSKLPLYCNKSWYWHLCFFCCKLIQYWLCSNKALNFKSCT